MISIRLCILYILQFILLPFLLPQWYPNGNEAGILFLVTSVTANVILILRTEKITKLLLADLLYGILVFVYHNGNYGIGLRGIALDGNLPTITREMTLISIGMILCFFLLIQVIGYGMKKSIKKYRARRQR